MMRKVVCFLYAVSLSAHISSVPKSLRRRGRKFHMFTELQPISTPVIDKDTAKLIQINHSSRLFFIGSCFSENMSTELNALKFQVCSNPQGIIFNPVSLSLCLQNILKGKQFTFEDIFMDENTKIYHSWQHHSQYSSMNASEMLSRMNSTSAIARNFLSHQSAVLFITLGTARVHTLKSQGLIVANCHKCKIYLSFYI